MTEVVSDKTIERHDYVRTVSLEGHEPEVWTGYAHSGKLWRPKTIVVKWDHGHDWAEVTVRGDILRKDGTPGLHIQSRTYRGPGHQWYRKADPPLPEWVSEILWPKA